MFRSWIVRGVLLLVVAIVLIAVESCCLLLCLVVVVVAGEYDNGYAICRGTRSDPLVVKH